MERLERRFTRLCFVQGELERLKGLTPAAKSAASFEDFVFSRTDFSRYGKISEDGLDFYIRGLEDFDDEFFIRNFRINREQTETAIKKNYKKIGGFFCLVKGNPLILSIMRSLETSLEMRPLVRVEEISNELGSLYGFLNQKKDAAPRQPEGAFTPENIAPFFRFLVQRLDGLSVIHRDGNKTGLFLTAEGLRGTFMPGGKSWTLTLIPGVF